MESILNDKEITFESITQQDVQAFLQAYNSNPTFLKSHLQVDAVTEQWVEKEHFLPRTNGFVTSKVLYQGQTIGLVDYRLGKETYLSLMLLDKAAQGKGVGTKVFEAFAAFAQQAGAQILRIDVVTGYENAPLDFWRAMGFADITSSRLEWDENVLPVIIMKKFL